MMKCKAFYFGYVFGAGCALGLWAWSLFVTEMAR